MEIELRNYTDKREVKKAELDFVYDTDNFERYLLGLHNIVNIIRCQLGKKLYVYVLETEKETVRYKFDDLPEQYEFYKAFCVRLMESGYEHLVRDYELHKNVANDSKT